MKNIIKPLEWLEAKDDDDDYEAPLNSGLGSYYICGVYQPLLCDNSFVVKWSGQYCATLEEAKAVCQRHYEEIILNALTNEAKAKLGIN